jgi:hypothetical protein
MSTSDGASENNKLTMKNWKNSIDDGKIKADLQSLRRAAAWKHVANHLEQSLFKKSSENACF